MIKFKIDREVMKKKEWIRIERIAFGGGFMLIGTGFGIGISGVECSVAMMLLLGGIIFSFVAGGLSGDRVRESKQGGIMVKNKKQVSYCKCQLKYLEVVPSTVYGEVAVCKHCGRVIRNKTQVKDIKRILESIIC